MIPNINSLIVFKEVATRKSYTAAAKALHISASAASKHVTRLESALGVRLINRSTHKMSLTEYGVELFQRCTRALNELEGAAQSVKGMSRGVGGTLRIHLKPGVERRVVEPHIIDFLNLYPDLHLETIVTSAVVDPLNQGFDVIIRSGTSDNAVGQTSIGFRELGRLPYQIFAAPTYLRVHGTPKSPVDLAQHQCLVHLTEGGGAQWRFMGKDGEYTVTVSGPISTNGYSILFNAAVAGLGIGRFLVSDAKKAVATGELIALFQSETIGDRQIRAFFPRTEHLAPKVKVFLDYLDERLADVQPPAKNSRRSHR
jgi:DNA-binding transcriptional LysR family regulator